MEPNALLPAEEPSTILFRPSKKRKIYRQRATDDDEPTTTSLSNNSKAQSPLPPAEQSLEELIISNGHGAEAALESEAVESTSVPISEILRLRKRNKRLGGVEFRVEGVKAREEMRDGDLVLTEDGEDAETGDVVAGGPRRFAPQTGTVGDVNKHMMEYIDSQLAKQRASSQASNTHLPGTPSASTTCPPSSTNNSSLTLTKPVTELNRQPAALGKLQEVDLGDTTRWRNEEQTRRKIAGEKSLEEEEMELAKAAKAPKKVRLGPDGKPWRSRRRRRGSDDIERDRIVEEVMRENRLEIYDAPSRDSPATDDVDGAADDRIAEAFKQEFMDAAAQRRQKTGPPVPAARTAAGKKEEEALKGPKLGGSRNARQAMRDMMLKGSGVKK